MAPGHVGPAKAADREAPHDHAAARRTHPPRGGEGWGRGAWIREERLRASSPCLTRGGGGVPAPTRRRHIRGETHTDTVDDGDTQTATARGPRHERRHGRSNNTDTQEEN